MVLVQVFLTCFVTALSKCLLLVLCTSPAVLFPNISNIYFAVKVNEEVFGRYGLFILMFASMLTFSSGYSSSFRRLSHRFLALHHHDVACLLCMDSPLSHCLTSYAILLSHPSHWPDVFLALFLCSRATSCVMYKCS